MKAATEARVGDKDGLDTIINEIMRRRAMIVPQAFHGGQLNGVHCRRLLNEVEDIMKDISKEATKRLKENIKNTMLWSHKKNWTKRYAYIFCFLLTLYPSG